METSQPVFKDIFFSARDGLRLYARHYAPTTPAHRRAKTRPALCLAGLTRNSRDFHEVAQALSQHATSPRDVYTLDLRGRGLSEHDADWKNYAVPVEMHDVIDFMTVTNLFDAGIIGTSRGGLITMVLAAVQPGRIGAVVLNDIGPVIDRDGLVRIASYVGRIPTPKTWPEAARIVRDLTKRDFHNLTDGDIEIFTRQLFNDRNGKPISGYDSKLAKSLSMFDGPIPALWPQFGALKRVPVLVIRGANSDLLSESTVLEMQKRHPKLSHVTVPAQGHAPLLNDAPTISSIAKFFSDTDPISDKATSHAA